MENDVTTVQAANAQTQTVDTPTIQPPSQEALAAEMRTHIAELRAETLITARTHGGGVNIDGLAHDLRNLPDKSDHGPIVQAAVNRLSSSDRDKLNVALSQPDTHPKAPFLQRFTRRAEEHVGKNFSEAFAAPLGPSQEFMRPTDQLPKSLWPLQTLNNVFYRGGGTVLDTVGRTVGATYNSVVDVAVDAADEGLKSAGLSGIPEDGRLRRDLKTLPEAFAGSPTTVMRPPPYVRQGKITGDPGIINRKYKTSKNPNHNEQKSAAAELRVAKYLREQGEDVKFIDNNLNKSASGPGISNDFTLLVSGTQGDVKRLSGLGRNAISDIAKGVRQVGPNGTVFVVRGSEAKHSIEAFRQSIAKFKPSDPSVKIKVLDEADLPPLN